MRVAVVLDLADSEFERNQRRILETRWPQLKNVTGVRLFCLSRLTSVWVFEVGPSSNVIPT